MGVSLDIPCHFLDSLIRFCYFCTMDIIEALKKALEEEKSSRDLYRQCAEEAEDAETRAIFEAMAQDEEHHFSVIKERLTAIMLRKQRTQKE